MCQKEAEVVQSCFGAFNRGDIGLAFDGLHPAIEPRV